MQVNLFFVTFELELRIACSFCRTDVKFLDGLDFLKTEFRTNFGLPHTSIYHLLFLPLVWNVVEEINEI